MSVTTLLKIFKGTQCYPVDIMKRTSDSMSVYLSLVMRKPAFCICENKDADHLRGNREADQRLCFRYTDSTIPLLPKYEISEPQAILCGCTARFVWDLVGNPEDRFFSQRGSFSKDINRKFPLHLQFSNSDDFG